MLHHKTEGVWGQFPQHTSREGIISQNSLPVGTIFRICILQKHSVFQWGSDGDS